MLRSWGLGPVFAFECVTTARRWRMYAGRALFVFLLMVGLGVIWAPAGQTFRNLGEVARIATQFFVAVVSIQLAVVMLVAPAATAGAVCVDKSRGTLHHVFVTDLTAREIVLGKLGSRLASMLALMACGLPVLALSGLLGGIDLLAALGAYLVTLGVAVLGSALALTFSIWARKPHQALLPTYALLGVWAGAMPALISLLWFGPPPTWPAELWIAALSNPILCAFAPYLDPSRDMLVAQATFLGVTILIALGLVVLAAWHIRPVALGQASRPTRRGRPGLPARLLALLPEPPLDGNPVLWREWHRKRPSRWTGRLWTAYAIASGLASLFVIGVYYLAPGRDTSELAGLVNGGEVAIGLLLLSISAPLALAEERDRGSLDVIMATPLPTRTIVWGKWWGTFATVPRLAILPIWVAAGLVMVTGRWVGLLLMIGMIFAPAAALSSLGLALATWIPRPGRAVAVSMLAYVLMTVGWSVLIAALENRNPSGRPFRWALVQPRQWSWETLSLANPFFGVSWATRDAGRLPSALSQEPAFWGDPRYLGFDRAPGWPLLCIGVHLAIAAVLMAATVRSFERCLGRVPEHGPGPDPRRGLLITSARREPAAGHLHPSGSGAAKRL